MANQSLTASSSTAPNDPIGTPISTLPEGDRSTGLETTSSHTPPPAPNVLATGSQNSICTQEILQVLTKEELKELIKARKLICTGIERHPKNGEFTIIWTAPRCSTHKCTIRFADSNTHSTSRSAPLAARHQRDCAIGKLFNEVQMSWSLTNTLILLVQSKEGGDTHYSKYLKVSMGSCLVLVARYH